MTKGYVDSYYSRTIAEDRPRPALDGGCNSQFRRISFAHCPRYWVPAIGKRGTGGAANHYMRTKVPSQTAQNSGDISLSTSFQYKTFDPSTQPSSQSDLDGMQITSVRLEVE